MTPDHQTHNVKRPSSFSHRCAAKSVHKFAFLQLPGGRFDFDHVDRDHQLVEVEGELAMFVKLDAMCAFRFTFTRVETGLGRVKRDARGEKWVGPDGTVALVFVAIYVDLGSVCRQVLSLLWYESAWRLL